jgi:predicted DNA-binding transcriptional regulator AlpA
VPEVLNWKRRLNTAEAAAYLGVTVATLRAWRLRGVDDPNTGPRFIRISPTLVVYDTADLDAYLTEKRAATERGLRASAPPAAA